MSTATAAATEAEEGISRAGTAELRRTQDVLVAAQRELGEDLTLTVSPPASAEQALVATGPAAVAVPTPPPADPAT